MENQLLIDGIAVKKPKTNTNDTTKAIIYYLNYFGCTVWRQNNGGVYDVKAKAFRKNPNGKLGVPDIIGFRRIDGKAVYVEVKTGVDKLSDAQKIFIDEARNAGCIALVVKSFDDFEMQWTILYPKE